MTEPFDTERITLSRKFTDLADQYTIEAAHWHPGTLYEALIGQARICDDYSRGTLTAIDLDDAERAHAQKHIQLMGVTATRRLRDAVHPPTKGDS